MIKFPMAALTAFLTSLADGYFTSNFNIGFVNNATAFSKSGNVLKNRSAKWNGSGKMVVVPPVIDDGR